MRFLKNKGKFLSLSLCSLLSVGALCADSRDDKIAELQRKIEQLQKDLQELASQTESSVDDLNERVDANELSATLNKVKMGLEFSTGVANTNTDSQDAKDANGYKGSNNNKWASEVHLNLNANIGDRAKFTGRLSMAKYWGDMGLPGIGRDMDAGRNPDGGSLVYLDRAYLDYYITNDFVATIGRLPGTDGPGSNLRNNSVRMSTYPALFVNALGDAAVLTYQPSFAKSSETAIRVGYSKVYQWVEGNGQGRTIYGNQQDTDANLYFAMAETKLPLGGMGDNLVLLGVGHVTDYTMPIESLNGPVNLGDLTIANLHFENNRAFGTPLSWFVSAGYYKGASSNIDKVLASKLNSPYTKEQIDQMIATGAGGNNITPEALQNLYAVANGLDFNEKDGWALHVGLRYDITENMLMQSDSLKVGYEYFHGSKYWYTFTRPSINDPLNFRSTRGNVHDVYAIYQLDLYQYLRLSYTYINYQYTNSGLPMGGALASTDSAETFMLLYNLRF